MPLEIRHSRAARADLQAIWRYIARDNPDAADQFLRRISDKVRLVAEKPSLGRSRPELGTVRSTPIERYVIIYRFDETTIDVVRVLSGYQNLTPDLLSD